MYTPLRVIVLLGPPGSGKGTQAARLSSVLELPSISTGEMLRRESQSGSQLGKTLQAVLHSGSLLADEHMNELVQVRLGARDCQRGCILDGFPRTVNQARFLDRFLAGAANTAPAVLDFCVSGDELIYRLKRRRQCPTCGRIYSADNSTLKSPLLCRTDRSLLVPRMDDRPEVIRERLRLHDSNSADLVRYYQGANYHRISASQPVDEVTQQIFAHLGLACPASTASAPMALAAY